MNRIALYWLVVVVTIPVGCSRRTSASPEYSGKLAAALAIEDDVKRDGALKKLAADAAANGEANVSAEAISAINDDVTRDNAASESVDALIESGQFDAAAEIAASIGDSVSRDNALSRVAQGRTGD
jgi:hypothetical protein